jgi:hypothetical protein
MKSFIIHSACTRSLQTSDQLIAIHFMQRNDHVHMIWHDGASVHDQPNLRANGANSSSDGASLQTS